MYFTAKSCIHTVRRPELDQKYAVFDPLSSASAEFRKIPRKHRHFRGNTETGRFRDSAQNSAFRGILWSLIRWY